MESDLPDPNDILRLFHLIHELCEAGSNTYVWREKFLIGMEEILHAQVSVSYLFHFSLDPSDIAPKMLIYLERGTNESWRRYLAAGDLTGDPITPQIMRRLGTDFTVVRSEFVDDATWYASDYFRNVVTPAEFGDTIYSQVAIGDPRVVDGLSLVRAMGQPSFNRKEVALVRLVHQELARLWKREEPMRIHMLPARQREVLDGIRRGESRKCIADKMGVSEHTVHSYEKALFERANVTSRGGLLAALSHIIRPNLLP